MKKATKAFWLYCLLSLGAVQQTAIAGSGPASGYYVTNGGDTVRTKFVLPAPGIGERAWYKHVQERQKYLDAAGEGQKMNPEEISEFCFEADGKKVHYRTVAVNWNSAANGKKIFLRWVVNGACDLFYYYESSEEQGTEIREVPVYRIKGRVAYFAPRVVKARDSGNLKNNMRPENYFASCPALSEKLRKKEIKSKKDLEIVQYYNGHCQ